MTRLCERQGLSVDAACKLFGHSRQAYYQSKTDYAERYRREALVIQAAREIREQDMRIGGYKLWVMLRDMFDEGWVPRRDSFYALLDRWRLTLPRPKPRHTTNSNHRFRTYKNIYREIVPTRPNEVWVADITYVGLEDGCCYLHLITDAYSHMIVGWCLSDSLMAVFTLSALRMTIGQTGKDDLTGLVHHSDRGTQYCCREYVDELKRHNIIISMTEDYKPTDNAIAERANGIIKQELIYPRKCFSNIGQAKAMIASFIEFYNFKRPHMSIGMQVPAAVHKGQTGEQKKMWKNKVYVKTSME